MAQDFVGWIFITLTLLRKGAAALEPSFDVPVINITVVVGKTAILPCSVEYLGERKVVWTDEFSTLLTFDNNRIIDDDRIGIDRPYERDWNLIIHDVRVKDRGRYICQINTHPIKTKPVDLYVLVPPQILNENEDGKGGEITTREGETVNVVCNVSGIPVPSVKWYRRPLTDTAGSKKERIGMEGEILVIHNISRYCDGVYQCVASNDVPPAVEMETTVVVEFQPEVNLINKRISQERGKETVLWCEVTAFPQTLSYWRYHGDEVVNSARLKVDIYPEGKPHTNVLSLRITNISEVDFGEYECYASNKLGQDREAMILYESSPPPKQTARQTPSVVYPTTTRGRSIVAPPVTYKPLTPNRIDPVKPVKTSFVSNPQNGCHFLHKNVFVILVTFFVSLIS